MYQLQCEDDMRKRLKKVSILTGSSANELIRCELYKFVMVC